MFDACLDHTRVGVVDPTSQFSRHRFNMYIRTPRDRRLGGQIVLDMLDNIIHRFVVVFKTEKAQYGNRINRETRLTV